MALGGLRERLKRAPTVTVRAIVRGNRSRAVLFVGLFTMLLTAFFVGVSGFVAGGNSGLGGRIPYYVLSFAIAFVVGIFGLDDRNLPGSYVLVAVTALSTGVFVLVAVATEGVIYAFRNPGRVFSSQVIIYFAAASLVCTGVGVWLVRHWREFAA